MIPKNGLWDTTWCVSSCAGARMSDGSGKLKVGDGACKLKVDGLKISDGSSRLKVDGACKVKEELQKPCQRIQTINEANNRKRDLIPNKLKDERSFQIPTSGVLGTSIIHMQSKQMQNLNDNVCSRLRVDGSHKRNGLWDTTWCVSSCAGARMSDGSSRLKVDGGMKVKEELRKPCQRIQTINEANNRKRDLIPKNGLWDTTWCVSSCAGARMSDGNSRLKVDGACKVKEELQKPCQRIQTINEANNRKRDLIPNKLKDERSFQIPTSGVLGTSIIHMQSKQMQNLNDNVCSRLRVDGSHKRNGLWDTTWCVSSCAGARMSDGSGKLKVGDGKFFTRSEI